MRYMNWDILIFPENGDTKTPLQEFSTTCTVIQDPDTAAIPLSYHSAYFKTVTHPLPTVSCFVPSLLPGSPFRISIHSWASPIASRATQAMAAQGNQVWFEAKVLVDGDCTAGILFNQDPPWPQVIDKNSPTEDEENQEKLAFPSFYAEMLTQIWTNAAQGIGTIRIAIAEGIRQGQGTAGFTKLRNVVTFSFQHAPLHVLENCGIAWPNPGMWWQGQPQFHNFTSPRPEAVNAEVHAHSPRRRQASKDDGRAQTNSAAPPHMSRGLTAHPAFRARAAHSNDPFWSQHGPMHDPFTGAANPTGFYKAVATRNSTGSGDISMPDQSRSTSSSHDEVMRDWSRPLSPANSHRSYPMPDYSHPPPLPGSRNVSDLTRPAMNELGLSRFENMFQSHSGYDAESQFEAMMASISPRRDSNLSGISAPSNTRASSAANTPPRSQDPFMVTRDHFLSYSSHPRSVSVTTRDPPPPAIQMSLASSKASSDSSGSDVRQVVHDTGLQPETIIKKRPVGRPKGRKEGKTSEIGGLENAVSKAQRRATTGCTSGKENTKGSAEKISDGKRKRVTTAAGPKVALEDRLANQDNSSPTRKVSKTGPNGSPTGDFIDMDDLTAEGVVTREPLGSLENRI